ncbi:MAG: family 10 glycosylhydrolase [Tissierellia bacterium]|nr:family 10 glycosylhydrolase [Tissierellia bacterium]
MKKINFKKNILFIIAMVLVLVELPISAFASPNPWGPYNEYMKDSIAKRHLRGAWVSTTLNLDWPSAEVRNITDDDERIERTKEELIKILDKSVELNMNAIFLQVSPEGDAFYPSDVVPWSRYLTGSFGKDPAFDPLAFAIEEAHKRNLEIHAWFNPYRVSMYTDDATEESLDIDKSVFKEHPDWIRTAHSRFVVDPGIPEAREWIKKRVMEVVENYDVDGIHFDDYFYNEAYKGELDDTDTFNKYNSGEFSNIEDWRRNNTYLLIKEIYNEIIAAKPWVKFGVSPTAVWGNKKDGHPDGSNTNAGVPNFDRSFADTKRWVEEEIIDYIAPQVYFSFANPHVPYGDIITWWSNIVKDKNVHLYIGQALYKVNADKDIYFQNNKAVEEFTHQHRFNIGKPEVLGSIMFRFRNFEDPNKQEVVYAIEKDLWATKSLVPIMDWKGGKAPQSPIEGKIELHPNGNKLSWLNQDENTAYYAIYRTSKGNSVNINSNGSGLQLIATVRRNNNEIQEFVDRTSSSIDDVIYVVTALDRLHHESKELIIGTNQSKYFYDVNKGQAWAIEAIDNLYERDIIKGVGNGKFDPARNISRADFLIMVMNYYGIEPEDTINDNFSDAGNKYYTKYLGTAKKLGLIYGVGDNLYLPENNMTRQDMFVILYRILNILGKFDENIDMSGLNFEEFTDIEEIDDYAREALEAFVNAGIIQGDGNKLVPKAMATRAQAAQVIYNIDTGTH